MSRGLDTRLKRLEEQQGAGGDREEEIARWRTKQERIRERGKENPEGLRAILDAEDEELEVIEEARVRCRATGEDPEDAPEVREAHRAVERAERRILDENNDEDDDEDDDEERRRN